MKSFMSHFSHSPSPSPRPDQSVAPHVDPLSSRSDAFAVAPGPIETPASVCLGCGRIDCACEEPATRPRVVEEAPADPMVEYRKLEARVRAEARERPIETPGDRRAMAVAAGEYPQLTCGGRRILVRAIVGLAEREVATPFERRLRAAYFGCVLETTPSGLINPTPMDWTALWLSQQLPGAEMHVYRALVAKMLLHVRLRAPLSPEQTRLWSVYRKAQSELGSDAEATR